MITQFCVDDNGYIIQDTVPRDSVGNVIGPLHLNPVSYDYDLISPMKKPVYNFVTKTFSDEGINYDYYIDQMNAEANPILKEQLRLKALLRIRMTAYYRLWYLNREYTDKWKPLNDLADKVGVDDNLILYTKANQKLCVKASNVVDNEIEITSSLVYNFKYIGKDTVLFMKVADNMLYSKSIYDVDNETQLTTIAIKDYEYIGNNEIIFYGNATPIYKKSTLDLDNYTALTTYNAYHDAYVGDNEIVFHKLSDGLLYRKSINDVDNETQILTFVVSSVNFMDNREITYIKASDNLLYKKSIDDLDNAIPLTTYPAFILTKLPSGQVLFLKPLESNYVWIKNTTELDNEVQLTNFEVASNLGISYVKYVGNGEIVMIKLGGNMYKKTLEDKNNEELLTTYNINRINTLYIPQLRYYNPLCSNYFIQRLEILNFIKGLNDILYDGATELSDYYDSYQTLREAHNICALQELTDIPGYLTNDHNWIIQMSEILGEEV